MSVSRRMHNGRLAHRPNRKVARRVLRSLIGRMDEVVGYSRRAALSLGEMATAMARLHATAAVISDDLAERLGLPPGLVLRWGDGQAPTMSMPAERQSSVSRSM